MNDTSQTAGSMPAFPRPFSTDEHKSQCNGFDQQDGMTLRDWFAGQAMAALVPLWATGEVDDYRPDFVAVDAYRMADEMIKARASNK
jgi:hypothetical protein